MIRLSFAVLLAATLPGVAAAPNDGNPAQTRRSTFTVWQLPAQTRTQIMSYVLRSAGGKLIVIDGGMVGDADYLRKFLVDQGGVVDTWFLTHPHADHVMAFATILTDPGPLQIRDVYASMPDEKWMDKYANKVDVWEYREFVGAVRRANRSLTELSLGQTFLIDGIHIEVLGVKNPELHANPLNNSSVVLRVWDDVKSVLFLSDLGVEGGDKLLRSPYRSRLHCEYVQMAHHGQNGVNEAFYKVVNPACCLWPTPRWLWDNDMGKGKGSGRWKTLEVRAWMDKLGVKQHHVMADGLYRLD
jgi:beta-lactamase superfamily II metal-dependent hydrolase